MISSNRRYVFAVGRFALLVLSSVTCQGQRHSSLLHRSNSGGSASRVRRFLERPIDHAKERKLGDLFGSGYTDAISVPAPDDYPTGPSGFYNAPYYTCGLLCLWYDESWSLTPFYTYHLEDLCDAANPCPLYVWTDGKENAEDHMNRDHIYLPEMATRGFFTVSADYDDETLSYASSEFENKAKAIFDDTPGSGSLVDIICNDPSLPVDCSKGIATNGWSQGAHLAALAGNYNSGISASLLFGNGNDCAYPGDPSSVTSTNLALDITRRRSIVGEFDDYFGGDFAGVQQQQIETSGYDCSQCAFNCENHKRFDCFNRLPYGCDVYSSGEQQCNDPQSPNFGQMYKLECDICTEEASCGGLNSGACPVDEGAGYYIVPGAPHNFMDLFDSEANVSWFSKFVDPAMPWGLEQNFDWLAARATGAQQPLTTTTSVMTTTLEPTTTVPITSTTATMTATTTTTTSTLTTTPASPCSSISKKRQCNSETLCKWQNRSCVPA